MTMGFRDDHLGYCPTLLDVLKPIFSCLLKFEDLGRQKISIKLLKSTIYKTCTYITRIILKKNRLSLTSHLGMKTEEFARRTSNPRKEGVEEVCFVEYPHRKRIQRDHEIHDHRYKQCRRAKVTLSA